MADVQLSEESRSQERNKCSPLEDLTLFLKPLTQLETSTPRIIDTIHIARQLSAQVQHRPFTPKEDKLIIEAHAQYGAGTLQRNLNQRTTMEPHMTFDGENGRLDGRKRNIIDISHDGLSVQEDGNLKVESQRFKRLNYGPESPNSISDNNNPVSRMLQQSRSSNLSQSILAWICAPQLQYSFIPSPTLNHSNAPMMTNMNGYLKADRAMSIMYGATH
eukprot:Gb_39299 [translate_table: standard]